MAVMLLGVASAFASSGPDAEPTDLTNTPQRAYRKHVGSFVTIRGRFTLYGKVGAMVTAKQGFVYIVSPSMKSFDWAQGAYPLLEKKRVAVTGILQFQPSPPYSGDDSIARMPDYYYFELAHCRIEQLFGKSASEHSQ